MKKGKQINKKRGALALSQIFLLIISIVAISYAIGSEVRIVSGSSDVGSTKQSPGCDKCTYKGTNYRTCSSCDKTKCKGGCAQWCLSNGCYSKGCECAPPYVGADKKTISPQNTEKKDTESSLYIPSKEEAQQQEDAWASMLNGETEEGDTTATSMCASKGGECKAACDSTKETNLPAYDCKKPTGSCCQASGGTKGVLGGLLNVKQGSFMDALMTGSTWGAIIGAAIYFIGPMIGLEQELVDAASIAVGMGVGVGQATATLLTEQMGSQAAGMVGMGVGAAVGIAIFIMNYVKQRQEVITFTCYPWQAPVGGESCEECNKQGILPCSEYQCRSLGQACQLLNKGTDQEKCAWVNKNDVRFPVIEAWNDALLKNYEYKPDNAVSPPDRGVKVYNTESSTGCVPAFTPLSFGVSLDEPAKCKIDGIRKQDFEEMDFFFSGSLSLYNHSYVLSLPGPTALKEENITIGTNGEFRLYVRCQDANGNSNTADFEIAFCVEKGPDTTPPLIVTTNPLNGKPIAYNQSSVGATVYINEPANCKWSHLDEEYDNMEGNMSCSSSIFEMNAQMLYTCNTDLTGLKDKQENKFYLRCKDNAGNINKESYEFTLIGTQPLVINSLKPENGTLVKDSSDSVKVTLEVETSAGYKEGESHCYYSSTGATEDYVMFFNTNSHLHSQDLWLVGGHYEYSIKCIDLGGNSDMEIINFDVESDSASPMIVRAYHEETYLKIVTNEPARCVYDTKYENSPCDYPFDDGTPLTAVDDVNHYTAWDTTSTLYVICQDEYGNQPVPNECSVIVRPSSEFSSTL